ncbi:MAG: putative quinol monooxygenase [Bermanella sp.]
MKKLWISAGLITTQGQTALQVKEAIRLLHSKTIQETGCIRFEILQHQDTPTHFTLWEEWTNEAALQAHYDAPHTQAYFALSLTEVSYIEKLEKIA